MRQVLYRKIEAGIHSLGLKIPKEAVDRCLRHLLLLERWGRVYNLTAIRDLEGMVVKHVLDSISVVPFISGKKVIDVGSGAGFPGVPMAIFLPNIDFYLLDGNKKKTRFLVETIGQLNLKNVEIINSRLENHFPEIPYDIVVTRAFSSLAKIVLDCSKLVSPKGKLMAMKARIPKEELLAARRLSPELLVHRIKAPNLDSPRNLVEMSPKTTIGRG